MGYCRNENFLWFHYVVQGIREALYEAPPCLFANLCPCFRHELYSVDGRLSFLEKAEAQTRQLVIVVPDGLIQLDAGR